MHDNTENVNMDIASYFGTQAIAKVNSLPFVEENIFIDSETSKECIQEMETNLELMKGMLKHLTSLKRTREDQTYQMKLIREIGFNIYDNTSTLEREVMSILK